MQSRQDKQQQDQHTGIIQSTNENHAIKTNNNKINKRESCNHSEEVDRQLNLKAVEKKNIPFSDRRRGLKEDVGYLSPSTEARERTGESRERREKIAPHRSKPETLEFGCRSLSPSRETRERQERVVREEKRSLPYTDAFSNRMLPPVTKDQPKNILMRDVRLNFL
ncbi:hypothetical protein DY000_02052257 [Brassica cretica]|uniref:Uncharacterized protein n=1 Tax=Brassica cretica TaxID=69181 RepID=A0ABQ7AG70_BRACR|nr:hypothetical protein DY000_02052257 [Brassica cretica]